MDFYKDYQIFISSHFWKCNFPMSSLVLPLVGWSVCQHFLRGREAGTSRLPIVALVKLCVYLK